MKRSFLSRQTGGTLRDSFVAQTEELGSLEWNFPAGYLMFKNTSQVINNLMTTKFGGESIYPSKLTPSSGIIFDLP